MPVRSRRVLAGVVGALSAAVLAAGCASPTPPRSVRVVVAEILAAAPVGGATASGTDSAAVAAAATGVLVGARDVPSGWALVPLADVDGGQALVETARPTTGAGVVAFRGRGAAPVALAVPLPTAAQADDLGVDLFVGSRASALVVAGSATAASEPGGAFKAVTATFADHGLVTVVVEGYGDPAPGVPDVVLRGPSEVPTDHELRLGVALQQHQLDVCVVRGDACEQPDTLVEEAASGTPPSAERMVRVQLAGRLATDAPRRAVVIAAVAQSLADLD